jgi:hypothetical protein
MTRSDLAAGVERILVALCGEQFKTSVDEDGDVFFRVFVAGVPVGLVVECLREDEAVLAGHHVIGVRVEDEDAAADFVARRNQELHVGRLELAGRSVVFHHHMFASGVNTDTVRDLLGVLASESRSYPDLAAEAGALRLSDVLELDRLV